MTGVDYTTNCKPRGKTTEPQTQLIQRPATPSRLGIGAIAFFQNTDNNVIPRRYYYRTPQLKTPNPSWVVSEKLTLPKVNEIDLGKY